MAHWKFGIIGCGSVADLHIEAIRQIEDASLSAVSSRNESKAKAVAERERCDWMIDYRELLRLVRGREVAYGSGMGNRNLLAT